MHMDISVHEAGEQELKGDEHDPTHYWVDRWDRWVGHWTDRHHIFINRLEQT
jgi:hypothetical protein